jgi:hypothetical protein
VHYKKEVTHFLIRLALNLIEDHSLNIPKDIFLCFYSL